MQITETTVKPPCPKPERTFTLTINEKDARVLAAVGGYEQQIADLVVRNYEESRYYTSPTKSEIIDMLNLFWQQFNPLLEVQKG